MKGGRKEGRKASGECVLEEINIFRWRDEEWAKRGGKEKNEKRKKKLEGLDKEREVCIFIFLAYEDERILNNFMCGRRYSK